MLEKLAKIKANCNYAISSAEKDNNMGVGIMMHAVLTDAAEIRSEALRW